ncbi:MAG: ATP-binding cassette domain-containing protein [Acidobacteriota bacterium]
MAQIWESKHAAGRLLLSSAWRSIQTAVGRDASSETPTPQPFWALRDVSFEVRRGEVLGIVGPNGAGKSTLLRILGRITDPTRGQAVIRGRPYCLLGVSTGFHPEFTGRENIYLKGAVHGLSRRQIDRRFDEVVAFAGVEKFLETPLKRYSSGMRSRLGFALATTIDSEILILDEVFAVGDRRFKQQAREHIQRITAEAGRTVLIVSHMPAAIQRLCTRAILIDRGRLEMDGEVDDVLGRYLGASKDGAIRSGEPNQSTLLTHPEERAERMMPSGTARPGAIDDVPEPSVHSEHSQHSERSRTDRLIAIYSHGKSGTTSIFRSLETQTERPIVRFHMLNPSRVRAKIAHRKQRNLKLGRSLRNSRKFSEDSSELTGAQFITIIRDPIAAAVSGFFYRLAKQDDEEFRECVATHDPAPLVRRFQLDFDSVERAYLSWLDQEIGAVLGLDVYARPFDSVRGSQVYRTQRFDLLVAKLECDDRRLEQAIRELLALRAFRLTRHNTAREKPYNALYVAFQRHLAPPLELVHRIYAHRSVRHFYTDEEIRGFVQRWTRH